MFAEYLFKNKNNIGWYSCLVCMGTFRLSSVDIQEWIESKWLKTVLNLPRKCGEMRCMLEKHCIKVVGLLLMLTTIKPSFTELTNLIQSTPTSYSSYSLVFGFQTTYAHNNIEWGILLWVSYIHHGSITFVPLITSIQ